MKRRAVFAGAIAAPLLAPAAHAAPVLWYAEDFEGAVDTTMWSSNYRTGQTDAFTRFAGNMGAEALRLWADVAPPLRSTDGGDGGDSGGGGNVTYDLYYTLSFDLYIIDTWDGYEPTYGTDSFRVIANSQTILDDTFSNQQNLQSFRPADEVGMFGYDPLARDSIYRSVSFEFQIADTDPSVALRWVGYTTQSLQDESWGIDNVQLSYEYRAVPAPASLLSLGALIAVRRRRR